MEISAEKTTSDDKQRKWHPGEDQGKRAKAGYSKKLRITWISCEAGYSSNLRISWSSCLR